ncbi:unnamed protein product, partial [Ectocarpus sp. 13 AM-2016]
LALQGDYPQAEQLLARAAEIWKASFGPEHPKVATALNNLAFVLEKQVRSNF